MEILHQRGIKPEETVYLGNDMLNDVWAAARAGWRTVLFAVDKTQTTFRENEPQCEELKPDAIVINAQSLFTLFKINGS